MMPSMDPIISSKYQVQFVMSTIRKSLEVCRSKQLH